MLGAMLPVARADMVAKMFYLPGRTGPADPVEFTGPQGVAYYAAAAPAWSSAHMPRAQLARQHTLSTLLLPSPGLPRR